MTSERGGEGSSDKTFYSKYYREIDVLHGLQSVPEEREWVLSTPKGEVKPARMVLYLGCNVLRTTHLIRTVTDVFKLLDVDFVSVGGASYCCGIQHHNNGHGDAAASMARTTVENFKKFQPERVVMWCPSCVYFYDDIMDMREDFEFQHVTEFLVENRDRLDFRPQPPTKVSLHYHTGRAQSDLEAESAKKLLGLLPGVETADIGSDPRLSRQCTAAARETLGAAEWDGLITGSLDAAIEAGADTMATLYHGCQRAMCAYERDYPLKVEHYLTVVGRSLGIEHEDLYKKHMLLGDVDAIMEEVSRCATASGIGLDEARAVVQTTFGKPA